jgi:hypothetical protein
MERFLASTDEPEISPPSPSGVLIVEEAQDEDLLYEEDEKYLSNVPEPDEYSRFVCGDVGYEWLLDRLRREMLLSSQGQDAMGCIRDTILQAIPTSHRVSRKVSFQGCTVVYTVDWDPVAFLEEQDYSQPHASAISSAITLTGSIVDAQAISCLGYMKQTWPHTGCHTVGLIQSLLRVGHVGKASCTWDSPQDQRHS